MIVERSMHPQWLSNTWLVADQPGGHALIIDTGGPPAPIERRIAELRLTVSHVLCTHHHHDHVANNGAYRRRHGCPVCGHRRESAWFGDLDLELEDGAEIASGGLRVRALHIPGHTLGQLAFLVNDREVFTGDTLFRGSVGGTRAPGHTSCADLRRSVMEVLMSLPPQTVVRPGHMEESSIGREWAENPFVRAWRGLDRPAPRPCRAFGRPAALLLQARDYDGGGKCWVRYAEDGEEDVVPGSRVEVPS